MRRTLFIIPDSLWGIPIFGFGLLLAGIVLAFLVRMIWIGRSPRRQWTEELRLNGLFWLVAMAVVAYVLPAIELRSIEGKPLGIAVRGYGLFLLTGAAAGLVLTLYRARKTAISADAIMGLAIWLCIGGILGARLFYVIEYRDQFFTSNPLADLLRVLDFTRGGLVVYGSILGGSLALAAYCFRYRISALRAGDLVIPALFLGLFFGRLGCLMNGCCYGGRCEESPFALHFPPGSPVYSRQLESGELIGVEIENQRITRVVPKSLADQAGIQVGSRAVRMQLTLPPPAEQSSTAEDDTSRSGVQWIVDDQPIEWTADQLPPFALAVLPAQIISSLSGLAICIFLLTLAKIAKNLPDGVLSAVGIATYAVARFGEEIVRIDEPGQFGTELSISQWVSIIAFPLAIAGIFYLYWKRKRLQSLLSAAFSQPSSR